MDLYQLNKRTVRRLLYCRRMIAPRIEVRGSPFALSTVLITVRVKYPLADTGKDFLRDQGISLLFFGRPFMVRTPIEYRCVSLDKGLVR
jgi:hypothetical protein